MRWSGFSKKVFILFFMSRGEIICSIDAGSANVRTVIVQVMPSSAEERPRVIGVGCQESVGIRKGVIIDIEEATHSIAESVSQAERMAGVSVRKATIGVSDTQIGLQTSKGVIAVGRADGEVTEDDISRVIDASQAISVPANKEILHIIPKNYSLDDQKNIKDPIGMNGVRLEVDAMIVNGSTQNLKNLLKSVSQSKLEAEELVLGPLAAAKAALNKRQKELGVVLVNIGAGLTTLAVYEENELIHTAVLPIGGGHITNDLAIGLRTSIEVAEKVKIEYGSALPQEINKKEDIDLSRLSDQEEGVVSRHHVAEIIEARLEEIFFMVNKELKSIHRERLLPAGVVLTGGTAKLLGVVDLAKVTLGLPAQTGFPLPLGGLVDKVDDPAFATAVGLILWRLDQNREGGVKLGGNWNNKILGSFSQQISGFSGKIKSLAERFLP